MHMSVSGCLQAFVMAVVGKAERGRVSMQATQSDCRNVWGLSNVSVLTEAVGNCRLGDKMPLVSKYDGSVNGSWTL